MTATTKKDAPKKKSGRSNQRAILDAPIKTKPEDIPIKKKGGRRSTLAPIVEIVKAEPGEWFKIATGKIGTIYQTRARLAKLAPELDVVANSQENDKTMGDCFARMPLPKA